jgi:hypothetical protein
MEEVDSFLGNKSSWQEHQGEIEDIFEVKELPINDQF